MKKVLLLMSVLSLVSCASTEKVSVEARQPNQVTGDIGKLDQKECSKYTNNFFNSLNTNKNLKSQFEEKLNYILSTDKSGNLTKQQVMRELQQNAFCIQSSQFARVESDETNSGESNILIFLPYQYSHMGIYQENVVIKAQRSWTNSGQNEKLNFGLINNL